MTQTVDAIYEGGVLRPVQPLEGISEHSRVRIAVQVDQAVPHPLADCIGIMPDEDAEEMLRIIEDAFGTPTAASGVRRRRRGAGR
jgi:predicted DNA-binding antitoxin AbrB/MazE fold protein